MHGSKFLKWLIALLLLAALVALGFNFFGRQNTPTTIATNSPAPASQLVNPNTIGGCPMLPADNIWNVPVDNMPVDPNSNAYINSIGANTGLHPDFGSGLYEGAPIGIPYVVVPQNQPRVNVTFDYDDESDPGPYPIPPNAPIEGGPDSDGDRHVLVVTQNECKLYETFASYPNQDGSWQAGSGAIYDLRSNALRPSGWTSADAAGLPILPGLALYEEVAAGEIKHALRFTVQNTRKSFIWPARHFASTKTDPNLPPMGQRFRLKANYDISGFSPQAKVLLTAMKKYGIILADNGSNWFISGAPNPGWNNDVLRQIKQVKGSAFEAVNVSSLQVSPDSGQVKPPSTPSGFTANPQGPLRVNLSWSDNSTRETDFYLERRTASGNYAPLTAQPLPANTTVYQDNTVLPETTYFYRVQTAHGGAKSPFVEVSVTTPSGKPNPPLALHAWAATGSQIELRWNDNATDEDGFHLERSPDGTNWTPLGSNLAPNVTTLADNSLPADTTYFYRLQAFNTFGNSPFSNVATATTSVLTVTQVTDDGTASVPGSLSFAFANAMSGQTIRFALTEGSTITITGTNWAGSPPPGVAIVQSCSAPITLNGSNAPSGASGLTLNQNILQGVLVKNFSGRQIMATADNLLICVDATS
jgi:hypothetical protein